MQKKLKKQGFTLVELIVVMSILMILAGSITSSIASAQRRASIQQATVDVSEITRAIHAYENFGRVGESSLLSKHTMEEQVATESTLNFLLGQENYQNGQSGKIPVLYNAKIQNGSIRDPWGTPYRVTIRKGSSIRPSSTSADMNIRTYVMFPNYNRRPADEVK